MIAFILNPLTLWISGAVVAAGVTGYVVVDKFLTPEKKPDIVVEEKAPETQPPAQIASIPEKPPEAKQEVAPKLVEYPLPKFDLLRVEKDGSAVIAGSAPAGSKVEIFDGDMIIATETSGSSNQFVVVLDKPLSPGPHELIIHAGLKDGRTLVSAEAGIINVPDGKSELLAMVTEPGAPSKIMQVPELKLKKAVEIASIDPEPKKEPAPVVEAPKPAEKIEEPKPVEKVEEPKPVEKVEEPKPVAKVEVPKKTEPEPKKEELVKPVTPVLIQAAEVEGEKLFIAGTGQPDMVVHIYIDGEFLGNAQIGEQGSFLFESNSGLKAGRHAVRADMTGKDSAEVLARAVVSLLHEPEIEKPAVVAKAEPKVVEPKPVEVATTEKMVEKVIEENEPPKAAEAVVKPVEEPKTEVAAIVPEVAKEPEVTKEIVTGSSVIIRKGDSLWRVSRRHYGEGIRYTTIFDANREQIRDPHLIFPGQVFDIPEFKEEKQD